MPIVVRPTNLSIESSLGDLADVFSMSLVEQNTVLKTQPKAQKWDDINAGDEVIIRFGLEGGEMLNFGTFVVDQASVAGDAQSLTQKLGGRDEGSKLIDQRDARHWGPEDEGNQGEFTQANPQASEIAFDLAALAGLGLSWEGLTWQVREFTLAPHETLSAALDRLLAPMRGLTRHRMDAWVRDGVLFVRQRGGGGTVGPLDTRDCTSWSVQRTYIPPIGDVTCEGARYRVPTGLALQSRRSWATEDGSETEVEETWLGDEDGLKVTTERKIWTRTSVSGERILVTIETTERYYRQVSPGGGGTAGKLLVKVITRSQNNLSEAEAEQTEAVVEQKFAYKTSRGEWFRVGEQTISSIRKGGESDLVPKTKKIINETQVTPTEIERTTVHLKIKEDGREVMPKNQPPHVEQEPGTLQSVLRVEQSPAEEDDWGFDVGGLTEVYRYQFEELHYEGVATGSESAEPQVRRLGEAGEDDFCEAVAGLVVAQHDVWRYDVELRFANEVRYQKGDLVTLSHIDWITETDLLVAVVTDVNVELDGERGEYGYNLRLQGWYKIG